MMQSNDFTRESIEAAKSLTDAYRDGVASGPYNQQFFNNYVTPYLPTAMQNISTVDFWDDFNEIQSQYAAGNPSLNALELYAYAMADALDIEKKAFFSTDNPGDIQYTTTNYDTKQYVGCHFNQSRFDKIIITKLDNDNRRNKSIY